MENSLRLRWYSPPNYHLNDDSVFSCGLVTAIGHITHTTLGSLVNALCVRTMRFLHLVERLPYHSFSMFVCSMMSKNVCRAPICKLPEGRPVRGVLVLFLLYRSSLPESVSPWQGDALFQVSLYVVNLFVGKIRHVVFIDLHLNDFGGCIDSFEILIVVVLYEPLRERLLVVHQLYNVFP